MTAWLLTWLWQGLALTLTAALLLKAKPANAATRYCIWWFVLLAVTCLGYMARPSVYALPVPGSDPRSTNIAPEPLLHVQSSGLFVSVLLGVWFAIALVKLVRLVPNLHAVYVLRDQCRTFPAASESQLPLWLEARDRGRHAELVICDAVPGATVLGFQRPCIALPSALVNALGYGDLDQIILHEYAHVQRRDDWARLCQALLQAALWIHPAIARIGRALDREREMACDEWVVARTGLPKAYARCLTRAAEVRGRTRIEPALLPALFGRRPDLVHRVDHLLEVRGRTRRQVSVLPAASAAFAIVVLSAQLSAVPLIGEYVELTLPTVAAPTADESEAAISQPERSLALASFAAPRPGQATGDAIVRRVHISQQANVPHASESDEPSELHEPSDPLYQADELLDQSRSVLRARLFEGDYPVQNQVAGVSDASNPWRAAAAPGIEIANAARKTGVGLAGAFRRASVALAQRF